MRVPLDLQRHLMMWANLENHEIESAVGLSNTSPMFREYRPNTSWRELQTRHEWSASETRAIELINSELQKMGMYDPRLQNFTRHYWKNDRSINAIARQYNCSKVTAKKVLNQAHNLLATFLGYSAESV